MRGVICFLLVTGLALLNVGCIASVGNRDMVKVPGKQAVALHGEIYIVDLDEYTVCKIDPDAVANATSVTHTEVEIEEE